MAHFAEMKARSTSPGCVPPGTGMLIMGGGETGGVMDAETPRLETASGPDALHVYIVPLAVPTTTGVPASSGWLATWFTMTGETVSTTDQDVSGAVPVLV